MVSEDEEWIKSALSDDSTVAELLLLLHRSAVAPGPSAPQPEQRIRQGRLSKGGLSSPDAQALKKGSTAESTRASPTTPLSWSGATSSGGGGADGFEESSLPAAKLRSKVSSTIAGPSTETTRKSSRRKKTLVELQEEENLLLMEQRKCRHDLANLHVVIKKQRAMNERLKKLKLDLQERQVRNAGEFCPVVPVSGAEKSEMIFELPDLNLPVEDSRLDISVS